ncbi:MAG TPA: cytochrome c peroxidase [Bacteroidia bacterium]|jgi:cytochrome c peroxidase
MKKILALILVFSGICLMQLSSMKPEPQVPVSEEVRLYILKELHVLRAGVSAGLKNKTAAELKSDYLEQRRSYKHIEFFIEYYSPREAKLFINGPLVPKHDEENGLMMSPRGFQVVEEILYGGEEINSEKLQKEYTLLNEQFGQLYSYYTTAEFNDGMLLEMMQLEIYRIASLSLNGYDATISGHGIRESEYCLEGIEQAIKPYIRYKKDPVYNELNKKIRLAKDALSKNTDFNSCNRLQIITDYLDPLNAAFVKFHNACELPWRNSKQAIIINNPAFFSLQNFNLRFFSIYYDDTFNLARQAKLGEQLFNDPLLSGDHKRSCASCHAPGNYFIDGLKVNSSLDGKSSLKRNTPSLYNVAFQKAFFYDGRAYQLEQQISDVIVNEKELHGNLDTIIMNLKNDKKYRSLFAEAFKNTRDSGITGYAVQKAITEYEKTLISFDSRFDRYLRGNNQALNEREKNGYNIFAGKALCGSCHFFPLFNGTVPPFYMDSEFEVLGVPGTPENKTLDNDPGRVKVTGFPEHQHSFKTPTVRNSEHTAPYMHNGVYNTLEEVIEFYHKGGGAGLGFEVPNQTLPFDSLLLDAREKEDLVLFLKSLSDVEKDSPNSGGK